MTANLYYFHDPMCSWCYAFQPVWQTLKVELGERVKVSYVLGGLAPDEDTPMDNSLRETIRHHWQRIQEVVPGTEFNFDFWTECEPRRSTYPACRAVIAATSQGYEFEDAMIRAIQHAYYRRALNPSDYSTHVQLAEELKLDTARFEQDLHSEGTEKELLKQIQFSQAMQVRGFPSLVLNVADRAWNIPVDYNSAEASLAEINEQL